MLLLFFTIIIPKKSSIFLNNFFCFNVFTYFNREKSKNCFLEKYLKKFKYLN